MGRTHPARQRAIPQQLKPDASRLDRMLDSSLNDPSEPSKPLKNGAGYRNRTRDPLITNQVLYQLS
jgi:hypothetical protein